MNNYVEKMCPFCKTAFKESDNIVICSDCDMPHHKDCWIENQGCTTFGCMGSIKSADGSLTSVTSKQIEYEETSSSAQSVFCTHCGRKNDSTSSFCSGCGSRITTSAPIPEVKHTFTPAANNNAYPYSYTNQQYEGYQKSAQSVFCTHCGRKNDSASSFCSGCGSRIITSAPTPEVKHTFTPAANNNADPYSYTNQQYEGYQKSASYDTTHSNYNSSSTAIDTDIIQLIGVKSEYYVSKFQELKSQNKKNSWNWCAFLATPYWLIYRKMYGYGACFLAGAFITSLIGSVFLSLLSLAGYIVFGIFANYLYMTYLEGKANQVKSMTEPYRSQFIAKNGGINSIATILTVIGYAVLVLIISL